jgi:hypothetical protein
MKRYFNSFSSRYYFFLIISLLFSMMLSAQPTITKDLPQYLFSDFLPATIKMKEGNDIILNLNYNTATGKMVFLKSGRLYDMVNPQSVDTVFMQQSVLVPYDTVFLDVLTEGKITFFIQHKSDIILRSKPKMTGTTQVSEANYYPGNKSEIVYLNPKLPEGFAVKSSTVYWVRVNDKMIMFTNERQLIKIFPEKADLIKSFIKESDLKIHNRADLIRIGNYCNEIMK